MNDISLIPRGTIHLKNVGKIKGLLPLALLFCISIFCYVGGQPGLGSFFLFPLILVSIFLFRPLGNYKPGKSFFWYRLKKDDLIIINRILLIILIAICLFALYSLMIEFTFKKLRVIISSLLPLVALCSILMIKLKFHENIDYTVNEELKALLKLELDENVVCSYSNFSLSEYSKKNNQNLLVVTNRQIYFARFFSNKWSSFKKNISEIKSIGLHGALYVIFTDDTEFVFRFSSREDENINHPGLVIRQFLKALDLNLIDSNQVIDSSRRRIVVEQNKFTKKNTESGKNSRNIEISTDLIQELSDAEKFKIGRKIEII